MARGDGWDDEPLNPRGSAEQLVPLVRPPLQIVTPHVCGAGVTPCGKPARLYPCGWRCTEHPPVGRQNHAPA